LGATGRLVRQCIERSRAVLPGCRFARINAFDIADADGNQVPDQCERNFTYDADGNLLTDENFAYSWDGENRLVMLEPLNVSNCGWRVMNTFD
jgi:hypothetical protein